VASILQSLNAGLTGPGERPSMSVKRSRPTD